MQITLNQAEIQTAVSEYLEKRVAFGETDQLVVNFKATRGGDDVVQVTIDVVPEGQDVPPFAAEPEPETPAPVQRKRRDVKHVEVPVKEEAKPEPEAAPAQEADKPEETVQEKATEQAEKAEPEVATQQAEVAQATQQEAVVEAPKKPSLFAGLKR